jgi:hypothetical protein
MKTSIKFCDYSQTFRLMPFNYWLASVDNDKLVFDSWDGMTKKHFKKDRLLKLKVCLKFYTKKIKTIFK